MQCYNGAIEACALANDIDGGMSLMAELSTAGFTPDGYTFRPLATACERNGKLALKQDLREAMSKLGLEP